MRYVPGNNIRPVRLARGLTQGQLAKRVGVSATLISFWERQLRPVPFDRKLSLCDALGTDLELLFPAEARDVRAKLRAHGEAV